MSLVKTWYSPEAAAELERDLTALLEELPGTLPPLNDAQWQAEFDKYRQIDQYRQLNAGMSLAEFKVIFFWEWFHRLWARVMGMVFAVGFIYFLVRRYFKKEMMQNNYFGFF